MKHIYQALDGKIFYDETECLEYEKNIVLSANILYFTYFGKEVTDFSDAKFVLVKTILGAKIFTENIRTDNFCDEEWRNDISEECFEKGGFWYYDDDDEIYKPFPCDLTTLYNLMKKL